MTKFYYVYVLLSDTDKKFYTGFTGDLKSRFERHDKKHVISTRKRGKLILVYSEACLDKRDAMHREKYLKTYHGKLFLKNRLKSYLTGCGFKYSLCSF